MNNIVGSAVTGNDFVGREFELELLLGALKLKKDVLILSPRRVGKSSISLHAGILLTENDGAEVVKMNAESATDEAQFFQGLIDGILSLPLSKHKKLKKKVSGVASDFKKQLRGVKFGFSGASLEVSGEEIPDSWSDVSGEMEEILAELATCSALVIILMDELPVFLSTLMRTDKVNGEERCRRLLNWLRKVQKEHADQLCWLLCGSIGLDSQVSHLKIPGVISDFEIHKIGPMPRKEASVLIWELSAGTTPLAIDQEIINHMIERIGWCIPCYIQLLYHSLVSLSPSARTDEYPSIPDVDAAYEILSSKTFAVKFEPWDQRLDEGFLDPVQARMARVILDRICHRPEGLPKVNVAALVQTKYAAMENDDFQKTFRAALGLLIRDGYLDENETECAFVSPILRSYWFKTHCS